MESFANGIVPTIVRVIKSSVGDEPKINTFETFLDIVSNDQIREQFVSCGGMAACVKLLKVYLFK